MPPNDKVDYDQVAAGYDRRYQQAEGRYAQVERTLQRRLAGSTDVLEIGCGTGHWLQLLQTWGMAVTGLDPSNEMLVMAKTAAPRARLLRGRAESLPLASSTFDHVVCVNAHHHFESHGGFAQEAFRVLRPGGGLTTIALDPSRGEDQWCIYDYFEGALEADLRRYPRCDALVELLEAAGFVDCDHFVAQTLPLDMDAQQALDSCGLDKDSTSQLTLLSDDVYAEGLARIRRDIERARGRGRPLRLTANLHLYATVARRP